jgi:hypothetical protein
MTSTLNYINWLKAKIKINIFTIDIYKINLIYIAIYITLYIQLL